MEIDANFSYRSCSMLFPDDVIITHTGIFQIESMLVEIVERRSVSYSIQDLKCDKCKLVKQEVASEGERGREKKQRKEKRGEGKRQEEERKGRDEKLSERREEKEKQKRKEKRREEKKRGKKRREAEAGAEESRREKKRRGRYQEREEKKQKQKKLLRTSSFSYQKFPYLVVFFSLIFRTLAICAAAVREK